VSGNAVLSSEAPLGIAAGVSASDNPIVNFTMPFAASAAGSVVFALACLYFFRKAYFQPDQKRQPTKMFDNPLRKNVAPPDLPPPIWAFQSYKDVFKQQCRAAI
jgi:hypothetical protein